jgi:PAS domain S-box-containing protein
MPLGLKSGVKGADMSRAMRERCGWVWLVMMCWAGVVVAQEPEVLVVEDPVQMERLSDGALEEVVLQLHEKMDGSFVGFIMALEQGYYRDAGLAVTIRELQKGERALTLAQQGKADFFTSGSGLLLRHMRGLPVVNLGITLPYTQMKMVVRRDHDFKNPADLRGLRVGTGLDVMDLITRDFLHRGGLTEDDVQMVYNLDYLAGYRALVTGQLDVYFTPYARLVQREDGAENLLEPVSPREWGADLIGGCFGTLQSYIDEYPERVEAFRKATIQGWYYAALNVPRVTRLLEQKYGIDKYDSFYVLSQFKTDTIGKGQSAKENWDGKIPHERWEALADSFVEMGVVVERDRGDLDAFFCSAKPEELPREAWWLAGLLMGGLLVGLGHVGWRWLLHKGIVAKTSVLMDSEERYRTLFSRSVLPILVVDVDTLMPVEFNAAVLEILDCSSSELLRMDLGDLELSESERGVGAGLKGLMASGAGQCETRLRTRGGKVVEVLVRVETINWGGEAALEVVLEDLREHRHALEMLEVSARRGRLLAEGVGEMLLLVDGAGVIIDASRAACGRLGYEHEGLIGKSLGEVDTTWSVSDRRALLERFDGGQSVMGWSVFRCHDGSEFESHVRVNSVSVENEVYRVVVIGVGGAPSGGNLQEVETWASRGGHNESLGGGIEATREDEGVSFL